MLTMTPPVEPARDRRAKSATMLRRIHVKVDTLFATIEKWERDGHGARCRCSDCTELTVVGRAGAAVQGLKFVLLSAQSALGDMLRGRPE